LNHPLHRIPLGQAVSIKTGLGYFKLFGKFWVLFSKDLLSGFLMGLCMVRVVFFRGSIEVLRRDGKEYVRIYVYSDAGGRRLVQYANKEVEGMVVVEDEGPWNATD
jgi:hypothetical protein